MNRTESLSKLTAQSEWDLIIIGGGATGAGCAVDAAARGYRTLLLEQADFGNATSSRSTKLVHGGVRYLQQGNISLVLEALKERGNLLNNAPHIVHNLPFIVPSYDWWEGPFYGIGLKLYDMLAGKQGFGKSKLLTKEETIKHLPTIETKDLKGGTIYYDGQFDDARLLITLLKSAEKLGAVTLNYTKVTNLIKENDIIKGVSAVDILSNSLYNLKAKAVINATGIFTDSVRQMDDSNANRIIQPSQGTHIILDRSFLPGSHAIMVPKTDDGRILFAIPWMNRVIVGTTDIQIDKPALEPVPHKEEIDFLLSHASRYLLRDPEPSDVLSVFSGIRPLVANNDDSSTSEISRDHSIMISPSGLITIAGGKWTTYRKMAEDTIDQAAEIAGLPYHKSPTETLKLFGYHKIPQSFGSLSVYGSETGRIMEIIDKDRSAGEKIHPEFNLTKAEILYLIRNEMVVSLDDLLSRRTRCLLLNARICCQVAPEVAEIMAVEMNYEINWIGKQIEEFTKLASNYIIKDPLN